MSSKREQHSGWPRVSPSHIQLSGELGRPGLKLSEAGSMRWEEIGLWEYVKLMIQRSSGSEWAPACSHWAHREKGHQYIMCHVILERRTILKGSWHVSSSVWGSSLDFFIEVPESFTCQCWLHQTSRQSLADGSQRVQRLSSSQGFPWESYRGWTYHWNFSSACTVLHHVHVYLFKSSHPHSTCVCFLCTIRSLPNSVMVVPITVWWVISTWLGQEVPRHLFSCHYDCVCESVLDGINIWIKALPDLGEPLPISWRPDRTKKAHPLTSDSEALLPDYLSWNISLSLTSTWAKTGTLLGSQACQLSDYSWYHRLL